MIIALDAAILAGGTTLATASCWRSSPARSSSHSRS
jgi:hypothetical protein